MPWQRFVADVGCELLPSGLPAYREVVVTVPRQSGKTTLFLAWQVDRCLNWGRPQRSLYTAQSGKDARDKWIDELFPLLKGSALMPLIRAINEGMGNEAVKFRKPVGSLIRLLSTSASSGHSKTAHQAVMDEIWADTDNRREQGLRPAMLTVPDAQLLTCSTAGTEASTVLNRKVETGRNAALEDSGSGVAYFEWSIPDGMDIDDPASWPLFMPALGFTQTSETIAAEMQMMPELAERTRAYGNKKTAGKSTLLPEGIWRQVCDLDAEPGEGLALGVDVAHDRSSAAIVAADGSVCELVERRTGTGWVAERCNELAAKHGARVVMDFGGPAGALADSIDRCGDDERLKGRTVAQACVGLYDAIVDQHVLFRSAPELDEAAAAALKRPLGDTFVWQRKAAGGEVLMAASLARWAALHPTAKPGIFVGSF